MITDYQITINMSSETVKNLQKSGSYLYGFKVVKNSDTSGYPAVWFNTQQYSENTYIQWTEQYYAYTSETALQVGRLINTLFRASIELGQTMNVTHGGGGVMLNEGTEGEFTIHNTTHSPYQCGIMQAPTINGNPQNYAPICIFPLFGWHTETIIPTVKILLMFSTAPYQASTIVENLSDPGRLASIGQSTLPVVGASLSTGLLIDLSDSTEYEQTVNYDINKGWTWNGSWAKSIDANSNLTQYVIEPP